MCKKTTLYTAIYSKYFPISTLNYGYLKKCSGKGEFLDVSGKNMHKISILSGSVIVILLIDTTAALLNL